MKRIVYISLFIVVSLINDAFSTNQIPELLIIGKDTFLINEYPLDQKIINDTTLLTKGRTKNIDGGFTMCVSSACWRGYQGTWTLYNDSLYLVKLLPPCNLKKNEKNPFELKVLFPESDSYKGIFAEWVNDTIRTNRIKSVGEKVNVYYIISSGILIKNYETLAFEKNIVTSENNIIHKGGKGYLWFILLSGLLIVVLILKKTKANIS